MVGKTALQKIAAMKKRDCFKVFREAIFSTANITAIVKTNKYDFFGIPGSTQMEKWLKSKEAEPCTSNSVAEIVEEIVKLPLEKEHLQKIVDQNLDCDYGVIMNSRLSGKIFRYLESQIVYPTSSKVKVFGKFHEIPRKQVAFGDKGTDYKFSGAVVAAREWDPVVEALKNRLNESINQRFNFVLVNR